MQKTRSLLRSLALAMVLTLGILPLFALTAPAHAAENGKMLVTVKPGNYLITKEYDGTTSSGNPKASHNLDINGILPDDQVQVTVTLPEYDDPNVGVQKRMTIGLMLLGEAKDKYELNVTSLEVDCEILPKPIDVTVTLDEDAFTYTGEAFTPDYTVDSGAIPLTEGTDYRAVYKDNVDAGTGTLSILPTDTCNYTWDASASFKISPKPIEVTVTLEKDAFTYTGKAITPDYRVDSGDVPPTEGTDYTAVYKDNVKTGAGTLAILPTSICNYTWDDCSASFEILKAPEPVIPQTGDSAQLALWCGLMVLAGMGIVLIRPRAAKEK